VFWQLYDDCLLEIKFEERTATSMEQDAEARSGSWESWCFKQPGWVLGQEARVRPFYESSWVERGGINELGGGC
jgi:hypothetical protein